LPVAAPSATDEIKALELARSRLETLLAGDENWRALTHPVVDDARPGAAMARLARNNRLEMALAGNELYQAWKHLTEAIGALRARRVDTDAGAGTEAPMAPGPAASAQQVAAYAAAQAADALSRISPGLMRRLEAVQPPPPAAAPTAPLATPRHQPRRKPPVLPEPEEATVTFVVRTPSDQNSAVAGPVQAGPKGDVAPSGPMGHARNMPEGEAFAPAGHGGEEAEVTILSPEDLEAQREAARRAEVVRRFRKALSGE